MSNIIQHLDKILLEARRNPEKNPKISIKEFLSKYENEKDVYVSFKSFEKIGINPTAKWGHLSPMGVYAYPIHFVINILNKIENNPDMDLPFAFDKNLAYVIKKKDVPGLTFIDDILSYSSGQLSSDVEKIKKYLKYQLKFDEKTLKRAEGIISTIYEEYEDQLNVEFKILYEITNFISKLIVRVNTNNDDSKQKVGNPAEWNSLFRKCLKYSGCEDKFNFRLIHRDIPYETIFFTTRAYEVLEAYKNVSCRTNVGLILYKMYVKFGRQYRGNGLDTSNFELIYTLNGKNYIIEMNLTEDPEQYDDSDYNADIRPEDSTSLIDLGLSEMNSSVVHNILRYIDKNPEVKNLDQIAENLYPMFENAIKSTINEYINEYYQ